MATCDVCGNEYDKPVQITQQGRTMTFDCFECAIHAVAPRCAHCDCRIIGQCIAVPVARGMKAYKASAIARRKGLTDHALGGLGGRKGCRVAESVAAESVATDPPPCRCPRRCPCHAVVTTTIARTTECSTD